MGAHKKQFTEPRHFTTPLSDAAPEAPSKIRDASLSATKIMLDALRESMPKEELEMLLQIQRQDIAIPVSVLSDRRLGALEAVTLYLKDEKRLCFHDIAVLLRRDDRTIWATYSNAKRKVGLNE